MSRIGWSDEEAAAIRSDARLAADESEKLVQRISSQRLKELKMAPPAAAAEAADDPTLTSDDKKALLKHLAESPKPPGRPEGAGKNRSWGRLGTWITSASFRELPRVRVRTTLLAIGIIALAMPLATAWWATPAGRVILARDSVVRWHNDDGTYSGMVGYPAGQRLDLMRIDADKEFAIVRGWTSGGYVNGAVAMKELQLESAR